MHNGSIAAFLEHPLRNCQKQKYLLLAWSLCSAFQLVVVAVPPHATAFARPLRPLDPSDGLAPGSGPA